MTILYIFVIGVYIIYFRVGEFFTNSDTRSSYSSKFDAILFSYLLVQYKLIILIPNHLKYKLQKVWYSDGHRKRQMCSTWILNWNFSHSTQRFSNSSSSSVFLSASSPKTSNNKTITEEWHGFLNLKQAIIKPLQRNGTASSLKTSNDNTITEEWQGSNIHARLAAGKVKSGRDRPLL